MSTLDHGAYSTIAPNDWQIAYADLQHPIEGMRDGWQKRIIANYWLIGKNHRGPYAKKVEQGFLFALRALAAEEMPPAYQRALPIVRFQLQLKQVIHCIENGLDWGESIVDDTPEG